MHTREPEEPSGGHLGDTDQMLLLLGKTCVARIILAWMIE
jgi:hypothetical protein